eukprot:TRINITY_DN22754_c0_g1_i4.p1 TRINITY_DN22754_c0_g1~~TRINITY_DN22754_c0_g1_i4.p1  ORF type:complete len:940 (+),score=163.43 TRINITY_DN22754_c0_g1_i4:132-2951(+)
MQPCSHGTLLLAASGSQCGAGRPTGSVRRASHTASWYEAHSPAGAQQIGSAVHPMALRAGQGRSNLRTNSKGASRPTSGGPGQRAWIGPGGGGLAGAAGPGSSYLAACGGGSSGTSNGAKVGGLGGPQSRARSPAGGGSSALGAACCTGVGGGSSSSCGGGGSPWPNRQPQLGLRWQAQQQRQGSVAATAAAATAAAGAPQAASGGSTSSSTPAGKGQTAGLRNGLAMPMSRQAEACCPPSLAASSASKGGTGSPGARTRHTRQAGTEASCSSERSAQHQLQRPTQQRQHLSQQQITQQQRPSARAGQQKTRQRPASVNGGARRVEVSGTSASPQPKRQGGQSSSSSAGGFQGGAVAQQACAASPAAAVETAQHQAIATAAASASLEPRGGAIIEESNVLINANQLPDALAASFFENRVLSFWQQALGDPCYAASLGSPHRADKDAYWEKRRVQNLLRRVLEELQEQLGLESREASPADLDEVFRYLVAHDRELGCQSSNEGEIREEVLNSGLEALKLWPPELSPTDRSEVIASFHVPSLKAARQLLERRRSIRISLSRQAFREGLDQVPFNLPEFPVPAHLLSLQSASPTSYAEHRQAATEAVATCFALDTTGLLRNKDFFVSGLVSLEEIQRALPKLLPQALVEDAVSRIIRQAVPHFSQQEWHDLVVMVRESIKATSRRREDAQGAAGEMLSVDALAPASFAENGGLSPVCLSSPQAEMRVVRPGPGASRADDCESSSAALDLQGLEAEAEQPEGSMPSSSHPRFRGRFEPVTEPLPCREIREDPVQFSVPGYGQDSGHGINFVSRVVNWATVTTSGSALSWNDVGPQGTARPRVPVETDEGCKTERSSSRTTHQADEGAGSRLSWGTSSFKQELAASLTKIDADDLDPMQGPKVDPVSMISLKMHNECGGPYLAYAFARCCQLYERQRLRERPGV